MANQYSLVFLVRPKTTKAKRNDFFSSLEGQIKQIGGSVKKKEDLGNKKLAYQISKESEADFYNWHIQFKESPKIESVNLLFNRQNDLVIRYLFLSK